MKWIEMTHKLPSGSLFSPLDLKRTLGVSLSAARKLLWRYSELGEIVKLRNGLYSLKGGKGASTFLTANMLYRPSYISFETALSYHGIIPETIYAVTSATSGITREFQAGGVSYIYRKIKADAYGGYSPVKLGEGTVLMADPEKALADQYYFVFLKKLAMPERLNASNIDKIAVRKYIGAFVSERFNVWSKKNAL